MQESSKRNSPRSTNRWAFFFLLFFTTITVCIPPTVAYAQQEGEAKAEEGPEKKGFIDVFMKAILDLEIEFQVAFGVLSVATVGLMVILILDLRMSGAIPPGFVEEFSELVNARQFKPAFDLCKADGSFLARVLSTGMGRLQYGIEDARHAAMNTVESIRANKGQIVNYLAICGTLGPMVGLFGTVRGMIGAFSVMEESAQPNPKDLAGEISTALGATFLGIGAALVAITATAFFHNRLTRMAMDTSNLSDDLLTQMYHNSKKPAPAAGTQTAPTSPGQRPAPAAAAPNPNASNIRPPE
jgi:biopolymer transport protein ExbB